MSDIIRPTDDIKRRLLAGEGLTTKQTAEEYGVSTALLGTVIRKLKKDGHTFTRKTIAGIGQPKEFQIKLPTPGYDERAWGKGEGVMSLMAGSKKKVKVKAKKAADPLSMPPAPPKPRKVVPITVPVPALGTTLRVDLLMVNDDGVVGIGIRNGTEAWTAEIVGYTKREEQFDGN